MKQALGSGLEPLRSNPVYGLLSRLSPLCVMAGLVLFSASLTPSLVPRPWLVQGVLGGLCGAVGYMVARAGLLVWGATGLPSLTGRARTIALVTLALPTLALALLCLLQARAWQNGIRTLMGMPLLDSANTIRILAVAAIVFVILFLLGKLIQAAFDRIRHILYRFMPRRTANLLGLLMVAFGLLTLTRDGIIDGLMRGLDQSYRQAQELFELAPPAPGDSDIVGGPGSGVSWFAMGKPGRDFVSLAPTADEIEAFSGKPAVNPIRVYVGRAQHDSADARAELALRELQRLGAFERKVLVVASPTGTGWLDPGSHDVLEYMHAGDIATVAVQYSYLQSPFALIFETQAGLEQATATLRVVHDFWKTLPPERRPRLYVHGLSLGAWSSMHAANPLRLLDDPIDGAFWAGPPFPSDLWRQAVGERRPGTPYVSPTIDDRRLVRFASNDGKDIGQGAWGPMRIMFLQYASDPIVFYEPESLLRAPVWLTEAPAHDVSPNLRFVSIVTQFQLALDMAFATAAPGGFGHSYIARDYIGPWAAVTAPEGWSRDDSSRLAQHCDHGFKQGCRPPTAPVS